MGKEKDDKKKPRARREDLEKTNQRFEGILRVIEGTEEDGSLSKEKVEVVKLVALGSSLDEVVKAAGWRILGLSE